MYTSLKSTIENIEFILQDICQALDKKYIFVLSIKPYIFHMYIKVKPNPHISLRTTGDSLYIGNLYRLLYICIKAYPVITCHSNNVVYKITYLLM